MTLTLERLTHSLEKQFSEHIDLSDVQATCPVDQVQARFLTRAQAAFALMILAQAETANAGSAVTDGFNDNGGSVDMLFKYWLFPGALRR